MVLNLSVDTGRKLNVRKTFRRRPGYLLHVLYTFNLRPVFNGDASGFPGSHKIFQVEKERNPNIFVATL